MGPTPRFRVVDDTPREFPRLTCFTVEAFVHGAWTLHLVDYLPVTRPTREEAQALADRLERGEDISADQKRVPVRWWDMPELDPSLPVVAQPPAAYSRDDG